MSHQSPRSDRRLRWLSAMAALWLFACLGALGLQGCFGTTTKATKSARKGTYSLTPSPRIRGCQRFTDPRSGLSFCVPRGARLTKSQRFSSLSHDSFEAKITLPGRSAEIWLRRDPLPDDLPEGALAGPWLLRYTESYAQHRGARQAELQRKLLPKTWARYVKADAATWAAFPLSDNSTHQWEEVIILARNRPATRVVLSLRLSDDERQKRRELFQLLVLLIKHLRLR